MATIRTVTRTISLGALLLGAAQGWACGGPPAEEAANPGTKAESVPAASSADHLLASRHRGHLANKVISRATPFTEVAGRVPRPVDADVIRRQSSYLQQWRTLQPRIAHLPADEQEAQRATLKRAAMGN